MEAWLQCLEEVLKKAEAALSSCMSMLNPVGLGWAIAAVVAAEIALAAFKMVVSSKKCE